MTGLALAKTHTLLSGNIKSMKACLYRLRKEEENLKKQKKNLNRKRTISPREISNLTKLAEHRLEAVIPDIPHYDHIGRSIAGGLPYLVKIQEEGRAGGKKPRPFIEPFKKQVKIHIPNLKQGFQVVKKDIEDDVKSEFIHTMRRNKLKLTPITWRDGNPLFHKGDMVRAIEWRLVK